MSFSDVKFREFKITENSREKTFKEFYLPTANTAFHALIQEAIEEVSPLPLDRCLVADVSDGSQYFTISFKSGIYLNNHKEHSVSYDICNNPAFGSAISSKLYKAINGALQSVVTNRDIHRITNLWFDYFCLIRIFCIGCGVSDPFINLVVNLGRNELIKTVIACNAYKFAVPESVSLSKMHAQVDQFPEGEKHSLVFLDVLGKPFKFSYPVRISGPRSSSVSDVNVMSLFNMGGPLFGNQTKEDQKVTTEVITPQEEPKDQRPIFSQQSTLDVPAKTAAVDTIASIFNRK